MDLGTSTSSDLPRGIAARLRRSSTSRDFPSSDLQHGDFCATGVISKPPPPTNFLTYMYFLAEHKHETPVLSSVREFVDRGGDKIGQGATFSVWKGSWKHGQAAFKFLKDSIVLGATRQDGNRLEANHMDMVRRNREYLNAMRSLMFEIKIMAKKPLSQHRNIVRLLAISWDEDDIIEHPTLEDVIRPVLVVELAWEEHPDLDSFMKSCSQSPGSVHVEDVLSLASDVADGLAALHSFGVVHGDLKPHNILLFLDPDKAVTAGPECKHKFPALVAKIGDFGFSGTISAEEDVHGGTQFWNAPECLPSCPDAEMRSYATKQTRDIYSYALILVYLVTNGGSPFEGFATDSNAIDAAKLEGRVADHCCDLIRHARSFELSNKLIDTIVDFLAEALLHNPCDRLCNVGGVRELLTGIPLPNSATQAFTKATFFSIHIQGVPDTMEYGHIDLSSFWRGASTQIPESRKALLRRGVDFEYISTLTKEERQSMLYAGNAFINAENTLKGLPPVYPTTVMVPDLLKPYTNEQEQQLVKEFTELGNYMERSFMADTGTEEMQQLLGGLAYFYKKWEFTSPIVSLKNCIEMNQVSLAKLLIQHGKVSADEHIGSNFTLLHLAAMRNRPSFVPILLACGLDINQKGGNVGFAPLHEAIRAGSFEATIALLDAGADIELCSDSFSNTHPLSPFDIALQCPNRSSRMLSLLLDRGAKYGHTTQSLAVLESVCQYPDLLSTLLDHEPGLCRLESRKRTLLHAAVAANQPKSIEILLKRGADVNARDVVGRTPLATLSSINQLGAYMSQGNFDIPLPLLQKNHEMWNPKSFDVIRQLLIDYGGEEPDDYIHTFEERNMTVAVARYMYSLEHFGAGILPKLSMSTLVRSLIAGKGVLNQSTLIEIMVDVVKDQREVVKGWLQSMHFLAKSTEQLPLDSEVLGLKFTANFKKYLAGWLKPVNWDEMMDFGFAVARHFQDPPCEPQTPLPEGIDEATFEKILQEMEQAFQNGKTISLKTPDSRRVMSWLLNAPVPDDIDAAMDCLTSPYILELPRGKSLSEPARHHFEQLAALQQSLKPGEWDKLGDMVLSLNNFMESTGQPSLNSPPKDLLHFNTKKDTISSTTYQPSFLSDVSPYSPIWVCLPTESLLSRKLRILTPVALVGLTYFVLVWRVMGWIRWLNFSRIVSIVLLHGIRIVLAAYPGLLGNLTFFAPIIAIGGWLAQGSIWQMLLECHFTYTLLNYVLSDDSDDAVIKQVRFRMRYGFPEDEPVIMSHKAGEEWKYNFSELFESMWGNYSFSNMGLSNWIHRPDAVAAVLDQWAIEKEQGLESSRKNWDRGWWYYIGPENVEDEKSETKSHQPRSGYWKKFNFLAEDTLPDRDKTMRAFAEIEKMFHTKCRPELYQTFRNVFPDVNTRERYREFEDMFKDYPDILHVVQGIWVD